MHTHPDYDIAIVGGGIVGMTLACALARQSTLKIALLENHLPTRSLDGAKCHPESSSITPSDFDVRVSAITHASRNIFMQLGVWPKIKAQRTSTYEKMFVWDEAGKGNIHFDCASIGAENLGYIIENRVILAALYEQLLDCENVTIICPAELQKMEEKHTVIRLTLKNEKTFTCRLLVGADGAQSWVRTHAGISSIGWDYGQSALVTTVKTTLPHQSTASQRFLHTGPLAFLPLSEPHTCSIVWSTTPLHAQKLLDMNEIIFKATLGHAFEDRLGAMEQFSERKIFPLRMSHAKEYVRSKIALVGDAAHTLHPLAGQGINLGLLDAACLAEVVAEAIEQKRDFAALHTLHRYERWRKGDNIVMIAAMEGFKRLFTEQTPIIRWLRNTALTFADQVSPLKNLFIRRAMGLSGDLPFLAQTHMLED